MSVTVNRPHELTASVFDALAAGGGGPSGVAVLRAAELSKHLLLIKRLLDVWPGPVAERDAIEDSLERARQQDPERFGEVLGAPLVGAWTAIANRAALRGVASMDDFRHLAAWSMVACAAAGVDGDAMVPVRDGVVSVPGLGAADVGPADSARLVAAGRRLSIWAGDPAVQVSEGSPRWQPVRHLVGHAAGQQIDLGLDDLDPYRHGHHAPPAHRLPSSEANAWQALFADAWHMLAEHSPFRAAELAAGLRTLVPLQGEEGSARSATIRHAFGVFGLTRPPSAAEFAITLVHEFQHSKLSAILDLMPLTDPADRGRYFAPWRVDPRPLAGLLQGVYAFVGVADTWRALRGVATVSALAEAQFAEARLQVDRGLTAVEESGALTDYGEAVARGLRSSADALLAEPLPAAVVGEAERALARAHQRWRARNTTAA